MQKNKNNPLAKTWMDKVVKFYNQLLKSAKNILGYNPTKQVEKGIKAILNGETLAEMDGSQMSHLRTNFSISNQEENKPLSLQNKLDYAREIIAKSANLKRLGEEEERSRITGGERNVEATAIAGASKEAIGGDKTGYEERQRQQEALIEYAKENKLFIEIPNTEKLDSGKFRSSHFEKPNLLVNLRMNTRTSNNGAKTLMLEEIQSDWHQNARKSSISLSN